MPTGCMAYYFSLSRMPTGRMPQHSSNGLLMSDSLETARLCLTPQTQKKLDRLTGTLGVDVIDELRAVPGPLLHADAHTGFYEAYQPVQIVLARVR